MKITTHPPEGSRPHMTNTATLEREEAPPMPNTSRRWTIDLTKVAQIREARYRIRMERHDADPDLDPRLYELYASRRIIRINDIRVMIGLGENSLGKVSKMRGGQDNIAETVEEALTWRADLLPTPDFILNSNPDNLEVITVGQIISGWFEGTVAEWAAKTHRTIRKPGMPPLPLVIVPNRVRTGRPPGGGRKSNG